MDGNTTSLYHTESINVGACNSHVVTETAVTIAGAAVGDNVVCNCRDALNAGLALIPGRVTAANTVQLAILNDTAAPIDPAAHTYDFVVLRATGNHA